jgi:hypothetical protein
MLGREPRGQIDLLLALLNIADIILNREVVAI